MKRIFNEKGSALLMVLVGMMILYITSAAFTVMVSNEVKMSRQARNKMKAFYIAEAGLQNASTISVRYPNKTSSALGGLVNTNTNCTTWFSSGNCKNFSDGAYRVAFTGPPIADAYQPDTTRRITSEAALQDSSGGAPLTIKSMQSIYIENPFQRAMWADGTMSFESQMDNLCNCFGWILGNLVVHYYVYGDTYSRRIPRVDFPVGSKCCCRIIWCLWEPTIGTDWKINDIQGPDQFVPNRGGLNPTNTPRAGCGVTGADLHTAVDYRWDTDGDGISGLVAGVDPDKRPLIRADYNDPNDYDLQIGYCSYDSDFDAMAFPQFAIPGDPRMPGYSGNLQYIEAATAESQLKTNRFLQNVWVGGDLHMDYGWAGGLGEIVITIRGTVFINGSVFYSSGQLVTKLILNSGTEGPGTLIINQGNLRLDASGPLGCILDAFGLSTNSGIDTTNVNIIMMNGDLTFYSRSGRVAGQGLYFAKGNLNIIDHDSWYSGWCESKSCYGGTLLARDIYFKGNFDHYWNRPPPPECAKNLDLEIPLGFYNAVRLYNWRDLY